MPSAGYIELSLHSLVQILGRVHTLGNLHRAQIYQFELSEHSILFERRQTVPCRAIRGNNIPVPPPLLVVAIILVVQSDKTLTNSS